MVVVVPARSAPGRSKRKLALSFAGYVVLALILFTAYLGSRRGVFSDYAAATAAGSHDAWQAFKGSHFSGSSGTPAATASEHEPVGNASKALVVASISSDDTDWLRDFFPDWPLFLYVNDDPNAPLSNPGQIGRESMTYLTYIIDHYDSLPDILVFMHSQRWQWHNEDPMYDGVPVIKNLQLPYVDEVGYVNLRCTWETGCPSELHPDVDAELYKPYYPFVNADRTWGEAFNLLLAPEGMEMPTEVGVPCCSQFAVSKRQILARPVEDYHKYRRWLTESPLAAGQSGRTFEYLWHIIMGKPPVFCPDAGECFCKKFGLCDLDCTQDKCKGRYWKPYGTAGLPVGWPETGQGEDGFPKYGWWRDDA